jgi:molybdopterin-guanine dinucleotide biosynthesis protein A
MTNPTIPFRIAGAILAGGKARRMGSIAKGMLPVHGHLSLIERLVVHMMRSGVDEIIIAANDERPYTRIGCAVVPDQRTNAGPLAGIEAALAYFAGRYEAVLCLPCDLPSVSWKEMSALIATFARTGGPVVFARTEGLADHPLCAVVHVDSLDEICAALDRGQGAVHDLWHQAGGTAVHFDNANAFANLNSPDDVEAWLGVPNAKFGLGGPLTGKPNGRRR